MSAPPDGPLTRKEIHESINLAAEEMIRLNDASEDATTDEERERADTELYDFALALLADVAGPAIGRVLERERDCPLPNEPNSAIKGTWHDPAGINRALAKLLFDLKPALGDFPAMAVVNDLMAAVTDGASYRVLVNPTRKRGQRDEQSGVRRAACKKVVFAIHFHAGVTGQSIEAARDEATWGDVVASTWKSMVREIPKARRDAVLAAGKEQAAAKREGRSYTLSDPDAVQAEADLQNGLRDLLDWAVKVRGPPKRDI